MKSPRLPQRGAALITGLIFLVVLTMIGVTAARMSSLEERMSGNLRDRSLAMQAAELALRDAERDILNSGRVSGITNFVAACTDGLCIRRGAQPTFTINTIEFPAFSASGTNYAALSLNMTAAPSVVYGAITGAGNITGIPVQPRYLIEGIRRTPPGFGETFYYRITVRAQGMNANTVVWLQEIFRP